RAGASNEQFPGFLERWRFPVQRQPNWITPLISHGQIFAANLVAPNQYQVHTFDLNPLDDFDLVRELQNNLPLNPDDGVRPDLSRGQPYDEIGRWDPPNELVWISGLVLGERNLGPAANDVPVLFVTGGRADTPTQADPQKAQAVAYALAAPQPGTPALTPIA